MLFMLMHAFLRCNKDTSIDNINFCVSIAVHLVSMSRWKKIYKNGPDITKFYSFLPVLSVSFYKYILVDHHAK